MLKNLLIVNLLILLIISAAIGVTSQTLIYPLVGKQPVISPAQAADATSTDKIPPEISEITVDASTTFSTIHWKTDKPTDTMLNYNVNRDYGLLREAAATTSHSMRIEDLTPAQSYYFRIQATDASGNQSLSNDLNFTTVDNIIPKEVKKDIPPPVDINPPKDVQQMDIIFNGMNVQVPENEKSIVEQVKDLVAQLTTEQSLSVVETIVGQQAQDKLAPPVIIGDFAKVDVSTDSAVVTWKTDKLSNSIVQLVPESEYDVKKAMPYTWEQGNSSEQVMVHQVLIRGLRPATIYHFRVSSRSDLNLTGYSPDSTFKTKSILPEIYNAVVSKVQEDSATIEFTTNVPTSVVIEYTDQDRDITKLAGSPMYSTSHSIILSELKFFTYYRAIIKVENEQGEKTVGDPLEFITVKDIVAPVLSNINAKSTLDQSSDKTQTIVSWRSDEVAVCQFWYNQGLASDDKAISLTKEDDYTTNHVQVVVDFQMATVYRYWIECADKTGNKVKSDNYTILTPVREQSILDIILKNFEGTFGWLKKK